MADVPHTVLRYALEAVLHPVLPPLASGGHSLVDTNIFTGLSPSQRCHCIMQMLGGAYPSHFLYILSGYAAFSPWLAELEGMDTIPAGPSAYHKGTVLEHTAHCMNAVARDPVAVWMALCHDIGKCATDKALLPQHLGHEKRGEGLAQTLGERLGLPETFVAAGKIAARVHMKAGRYAILRPGSRRDVIMEIHAAGMWRSFWSFIDADTGHNLSHEASRDLAVILNASPPPYDNAQARDVQCHVLAQYMAQNPVRDSMAALSDTGL